MARFNDQPNVVAVDTSKPRDAILDHFDADMRTALDAADYLEVARLARLASAYQRSLWRHRGWR